MNGKTYINSDELTALANSLKAKSENILSTYKGDCAQAIEMSSDCLQLSGLNTTEFFQALEKIYTQVNERIATFADFLTNVVVAEYNAVSEAITNSFNIEFASEISNLLGIGITSSIGPITAPAIPGRPIPLEPQKPGDGLIEPIYSIPKQPEEPIEIDLGGQGNKDEVITLDPREKEGFGKPEIQVMSREEGNNSPTPVYLDDDGTAVAATQKNDAAPTAETHPTSETTSTSSGTKPNLPPLKNETGGRGHAANDPIRAVQFDEGTSSSAKATVQPSTPTVETTKPSTATTTVSTGGTKPNLPPLPTKPSTSTSTRSYSSGGYINTGGGGGGGMAAAIALESMSNPLNRLK